MVGEVGFILMGEYQNGIFEKRGFGNWDVLSPVG